MHIATEPVLSAGRPRCAAQVARSHARHQSTAASPHPPCAARTISHRIGTTLCYYKWSGIGLQERLWFDQDPRVRDHEPPAATTHVRRPATHPWPDSTAAPPRPSPGPRSSPGSMQQSASRTKKPSRLHVIYDAWASRQGPAEQPRSRVFVQPSPKTATASGDVTLASTLVRRSSC